MFLSYNTKMLFTMGGSAAIVVSRNMVLELYCMIMETFSLLISAKTMSRVSFSIFKAASKPKGKSLKMVTTEGFATMGLSMATDFSLMVPSISTIEMMSMSRLISTMAKWRKIGFVAIRVISLPIKTSCKGIF